MTRWVLLFRPFAWGLVSPLTVLVSSQLLFDPDKELFPMVIQAAVAEGEGELFHVR